MTIYTIGLVSTTDHRVYYTIVVDTERKSVECDCIGCRTHGYCKHIKFYKKLIKELIK